jgi:hypothetical protein
VAAPVLVLGHHDLLRARHSAIVHRGSLVCALDVLVVKWMNMSAERNSRENLCSTTDSFYDNVKEIME